MVQDGSVPPLDREASGIITGSEDILKALASKHSLNARALVINDVIKDVLKNPAFNADEVNLVGGNHGHLHLVVFNGSVNCSIADPRHDAIHLTFKVTTS
jgi:hypothetical protein